MLCGAVEIETAKAGGSHGAWAVSFRGRWRVSSRRRRRSAHEQVWSWLRQHPCRRNGSGRWTLGQGQPTREPGPLSGRSAEEVGTLGSSPRSRWHCILSQRFSRAISHLRQRTRASFAGVQGLSSCSPDELTLIALMSAAPEHKPQIEIQACYVGEQGDGRKALASSASSPGRCA